MASERQIPGTRPADLTAAMGSHGAAHVCQWLGLEGGDTDTCDEQNRAASGRNVFSRRTMARVYVERVRTLGGVRTLVSWYRCSVAGVDVGRFSCDVVATPQRTVLPLARFSSDGGFVHDRRQHLSIRPAAEVVGSAD